MLMYLYTSDKYVGADRKSHLQGNRFIEQNKSTDLTNARPISRPSSRSSEYGVGAYS